MQSVRDVESFQECINRLKVVVGAVFLSNSNNQIINTKHHTRLKNVFEELVVINSASCFKFDNDFPIATDGVG
jgi:hypothetical protein